MSFSLSLYIYISFLSLSLFVSLSLCSLSLSVSPFLCLFSLSLSLSLFLLFLSVSSFCLGFRFFLVKYNCVFPSLKVCAHRARAPPSKEAPARNDAVVHLLLMVFACVCISLLLSVCVSVCVCLFSSPRYMLSLSLSFQNQDLYRTELRQSDTVVSCVGGFGKTDAYMGLVNGETNIKLAEVRVCVC